MEHDTSRREGIEGAQVMRFLERQPWRAVRRAVCATGVSARIPKANECKRAPGDPAASDLEQTAFGRFFMSVAPTLRGQNSGSMERDSACLYLRRQRARLLPFPVLLPPRCCPSFPSCFLGRIGEKDLETSFFFKQYPAARLPFHEDSFSLRSSLSFALHFFSLRRSLCIYSLERNESQAFWLCLREGTRRPDNLVFSLASPSLALFLGRYRTRIRVKVL